MSLTIVNHGDWVEYTPASPLGTVLGRVLCARRVADGMDWYDFVRGKTLSASTLKATVRNGTLQVLTTQADRLFPAGCTLIEISGVTDADPQATYGRMRYVYDAAANTIAPAPPKGKPS